MQTGPQRPARTEDDLRAALITLERHAPAADTVLRAVRGATGRRMPTPRTLRPSAPPRWLRPRLAVGIAAAAAAAGLAIALLPGGARPPAGGVRPGAASAGGLPSPATVGKAMLTALSTPNGDVLYETTVTTRKGFVIDTERDWSWPAQPVVGQRARYRSASSERLSQMGPLKLSEDYVLAYTAMPTTALHVYGELTMVCYSGGTGSGCGYGFTETPAGTWSLHRGRFLNPSFAGGLTPSELAHAIANGQWRVTRRIRLGGQPAIELTETRSGSFQPTWGVKLWVNARTYLPLRMHWPSGHATVSRSNWYYLKPTKPNLNLLQVPIPAGYPRSKD